jgi:hypothetical protein
MQYQSPPKKKIWNIKDALVKYEQLQRHPFAPNSVIDPCAFILSTSCCSNEMMLGCKKEKQPL